MCKAQTKREFSNVAVHTGKSQNNEGQAKGWHMCVRESTHESKGAYKAL